MEKYNLFRAVSEVSAALNEKELFEREGLATYKQEGIVINNDVMQKLCEKDITAQAHLLDFKILENNFDMPESPLAYYMLEDNNLVRIECAAMGCLVVYESLDTDYADVTSATVGAAVCNAIGKTNADVTISDDIYPDQIIWSQNIRKLYNEKYGEEVLDKLAMLFVAAKGSVRFRGRYYKLLNELTYENLLLPIKNAAKGEFCATVGEHKATALPNNTNMASFGCFDKLLINAKNNDITYLTFKRYNSLCEHFGLSKVAVVASALIEENGLDSIKYACDALFANGIKLILIEEKESKDVLYTAKYEYIKKYCDLTAAYISQMIDGAKTLVLFASSTGFIGENSDHFDKAFAAGIQRLDKNGVFYDIIDETLFKNAFVDENRKLTVGDKQYESVILLDAENVSFTTANKLQELLEQHVTVITSGKTLRLIDGVKSARVDEISKKLERVRRIEDAAVDKLFVLSDFTPCKFGVLPDKSRLVMLKNSDAKISFTGSGQTGAICVLDARERKLEKAKGFGGLFAKKGYPVDCESLISFGSQRILRDRGNAQILETGEMFDIKSLSNNILPLTKCEAAAKGKFKYTVLNNGYRGDCLLYVPANSCLTVKVNGRVAEGENGVFNITKQLKDGANEIVVSARADAVYLMGNFGVSTDSDVVYTTDGDICVGGEFSLCERADRLDINKIRESGFWFFAGKMELSCDVYIDKAVSGRYKLSLSRMDVALVDVSVNGVPAGKIGFYPYEKDISDLLHDGENRISLTLYSNQNKPETTKDQDGNFILSPFGVGLKRRYLSFIEINNASKIYKGLGQEVYALNKVDLSVQRGEFVVISGTTGGGKTTLLNLIGGIDIADEGNVVVDGKNLAEMSKQQLNDYVRDRVSFVLQRNNLIESLTVRENVELAATLRQDSVNTEIVLNALSLGKKADYMPTQLSVGEQQCVAVARAIAKNAELLLCDEPTAALDSDMAKTVIDLLYETCKTAGKTILLVTGDVYAVEKADRVVRLKDGCVIENTENN